MTTITKKTDAKQRLTDAFMGTERSELFEAIEREITCNTQITKGKGEEGAGEDTVCMSFTLADVTGRLRYDMDVGRGFAEIDDGPTLILDGDRYDPYNALLVALVELLIAARALTKRIRMPGPSMAQEVWESARANRDAAYVSDLVVFDQLQRAMGQAGNVSRIRFPDESFLVYSVGNGVEVRV